MFVKLPQGEWINIDLVRRIQIELDPPLVHLTWNNGDTAIYRNVKALAIVRAVKETLAIKSERDFEYGKDM